MVNEKGIILTVSGPVIVPAGVPALVTFEGGSTRWDVHLLVSEDGRLHVELETNTGMHSLLEDDIRKCDQNRGKNGSEFNMTFTTDSIDKQGRA